MWGEHKFLLKKYTFLGIVPTSLGIFTYWKCRYLSPYQTDISAFLSLLLPFFVIFFFSYGVKRKLGYLDHDYLYLVSAAPFLLAIIDLLWTGQQGERSSVLLYIFSRFAPAMHVESIRYLLSAISQSLAALFGIVFSLTFVCAQLYIQLYEPTYTGHMFRRPSTILLVAVYVFFILYNLLLLKKISTDTGYSNFQLYSPQFERYIVISFFGTLLCSTLLIPYLISINAELNPRIVTKTILSEAKDGSDNVKKKAVERITLNMKYWYLKRKNLFASAKVSLDCFLIDIREKVRKETLEEIKTRIESFDDIIDEDPELVSLLVEEYSEFIRGSTERNDKAKILRGLDFCKCYMLKLRSEKFTKPSISNWKLIAGSLDQLLHIGSADLPPEQARAMGPSNPFTVEDAQLKTETSNENLFDVCLVTTLERLGILYWKLKEFGNAEQCYLEAVRVYSNLRRGNLGIARMWGHLGNLYSSQINTDIAEESCSRIEKFEEYYLKAEEYYIRAERICNKFVKYSPEVKLLLAGIRYDLGNLYCKWKKLKEGENCLVGALDIYRSVEEDPSIRSDKFITLYKLGNLYWNNKEYEKAVECHKEALETITAEGDLDTELDLFEIHSNLALYYEESSHHSEAIDHYVKALEISKRLVKRDRKTYEPYLATTLNDLGKAYRRSEKFKEARECYGRAFGIRKKLAKKRPEFESDAATTLISLGGLHSDLREYRKAEKCFKGALKIYKNLLTEDSRFKIDVALAFYNLGLVYRDERNNIEAEEYFVHALNVLAELDQKVHRISSITTKTLIELGKLSLYSGNLEKAKKYSDRASKSYHTSDNEVKSPSEDCS